MFGRGKNKKNQHLENQMSGFIGHGISIEGRINFEGSLRIDGDFKGEIDSSGLLIIGEGAVLEAVINVDSAIISGEVKGDIDAKNRVELKQPARMYGNVRTHSIVVEEGVIFEGKCLMKGSGGNKASETELS